MCDVGYRLSIYGKTYPHPSIFSPGTGNLPRRSEAKNCVNINKGTSFFDQRITRKVCDKIVSINVISLFLSPNSRSPTWNVSVGHERKYHPPGVVRRNSDDIFSWTAICFSCTGCMLLFTTNNAHLMWCFIGLKVSSVHQTESWLWQLICCGSGKKLAPSPSLFGHWQWKYFVG